MIKKAYSKKGNSIKIARGFSQKELKEVGLPLHSAKKMDIPIDVRRKTAHKSNIEILKKILKPELEESKKKKPTIEKSTAKKPKIKTKVKS